MVFNISNTFMMRGNLRTVVKSRNIATPIFLILFLIALFAPFVNKPFNIDDPLFIWAAKHIQYNPLDFYGFDVNWYKTAMPMAVVTKNPPLFSYFLAGVGILFGWSEVTMHLAVMLLLMFLAFGTLRLAGQLNAKPLQATLIAFCTPVVMTSGTTVMCDVPMVTLWVWAVSFWIDGTESTNNNWLMFAASIMIAAAGLTKYFGASLVPLLASYSLMRRTPVRRWLPYLLIPLVIFFLYELVTFRMYGIGLFTDAFSYSADYRQKLHPNFALRIIDSLSFTGGGLIVVLFFTPLIFRFKGRLICAGAIVSLSLISFLFGIGKGSDFSISVQQAAFITAAGVLFTMAVSDLIRNKDAKSLLLALWVMGTYLFASAVNWTVNERIILPMAPAVGILISRWLVQNKQDTIESNHVGFVLALTPALLLSCLVTFADYRWASEIKITTQHLSSYSPKAENGLWFQGHWGFQYYMEQIGGKYLDVMASEVRTGDILVRPSFTTNFENLPDNLFEEVGTLSTAPFPWLAVMDPSIGAGLYSSVVGPLPYVFGRVEPETYWIHSFKQNIHFFKGKK